MKPAVLGCGDAFGSGGGVIAARDGLEIEL
jgi:hypothetical protein